MRSGIRGPLRWPRRLIKEVRTAGANVVAGTHAVRAARLVGPPSVYYGYRHIPTLDERSHGGMVKFQHMQAAFPNAPDAFTILYMVSSQPPPGAIGLARVAKRRGASVVWNQNGVGYPAWAGSDWRDVNRPMKQMLGLADHVFYQSEFCRVTADRFVGTPGGTSEVLYNPVDTTHFTPGTRQTGRNGGALVLLLGGTQYQRYRLVAALETLAQVRRTGPDAHLLVTGRLNWIPDERAARREAHELALRLGIEHHVTYSGPYTQRQAPGVLQQADILVHTKYNDPSPGLVLEALACGLPVAYSRSGGVPEMVGEDAGVGVETPVDWKRDHPPDPETLARAVLTITADLPRFSAAARARAVEKFDLSLWIDRHKRVFERLR